MLNDRPKEVSRERKLGIARENNKVAVGKFAEEKREVAEAGKTNQGGMNSRGTENRNGRPCWVVRDGKPRPFKPFHAER
jgi:hypothetical protein